MRLFTVLAIVQLAQVIGCAQDTFEVASVKVAAPLAPNEIGNRRVGGPGTESPERVSWRRVRMDMLIELAYGVRRNQIVGPGWISLSSRDTSFDISATLAPGVSQDQLAVMVQGLLKERFKFRSHREMRDRPVYMLTVAKGGDKLTRSSADSDVQPLEFRNLPGVRTQLTSRAVPLAALVAVIESVSGTVGEYALAVDETRLDGKFDIELPSINNYEHSLAGLIASIEKDLGLKVERGHAQVEVLVIDQVEKVPTEN